MNPPVMRDSGGESLRTAKSKKQKFADFNGIRVLPKSLILKNAYEGKHYREKISIQNVQRFPVIIKTIPPTYSGFKLENPLNSYKLPSGLSVSIRLAYTVLNCLINPTVECTMTIMVNGKPFEYYICVQVSSGNMYSIPKIINFGIVNIEHSVHTRTVTIRNKGFKTSKFEIDLASNELGLTISPTQGFIPARSERNIRIEFIGESEGVFFKEIWVKCDTPFRIMVSVTVIRPKLIVSGGLKCTHNFYVVKFDPIYNNCKSYVSTSFINFNTLNASFVVVPEVKGSILSFQKATQIDPTYNYFLLDPIDGVLEPDEEKSIRLCFKPERLKLKRRQMFFVLFRIIQLSTTNIGRFEDPPIPSGASQTVGSSNDPEELPNMLPSDLEASATDVPSSVVSFTSLVNGQRKTGNYIRLYLCSSLEPLNIIFEPEFINVGHILINTSNTCKLTITNENNVLPIYFKYCKTAFIEITPNYGFMPSMSSQELTMKFTPKATKRGKIDIIIEFLYPNQPSKNVDTEKNLQYVGEIRIPLYSKVDAVIQKPQPKFNSGITPMITNEVGFLTHNIRFSDEMPKPRQAMVDMAKVKKNENALIAFPNDRALTLRRTNDKHEIIKTIFAKIPRYIMDQDIYMLSDEETKFKNVMYQYYKEYIQQGKAVLPYISPLIETDYDEVSDLGNCRKDKSKAYVENTDREKKLRTSNYMNLTPIQLFFIKVAPSLVDVSKMAVNSTIDTRLRILNQNTFSIKVVIKIQTSYETILKCIPQQFTVAAYSSKSFDLEFSPEVEGRFHTIISAVINDCHVLPVIFKSHIIAPTLYVNKNDVVVNLLDITSSKSLNIINVLNVPISYDWIPSAGSAFTVVPSHGKVPPFMYIKNEINFDPTISNRISTRLQLDCHRGNKLSITATVCVEKIDVMMLEKTVEMNHIPLNMATKGSAILINKSYQPILYSIKNPCPVSGIKLFPYDGVIQRRSYQIITIQVLMKVISSFDCKIEIEVPNAAKPVSFNLKGFVDFPLIVLKPDMIHLRRIPAGAFDFYPFSIENKASSIVKINFDQESAPDFCISKTATHDFSQHTTEFFLNPGEKNIYILKYFPVDVSMTMIYLPFIINDILGPAKFDDQNFSNTATYLVQHQERYSVTSELNILPYPEKLPVVTVESIASRPIVKISRMYLTFQLLNHPKYKKTTRLETQLKNIYSTDLEICIRLDEMKPNFTLDTKDIEFATVTDVAISIIMEPNEIVSLIFEFVPTKPGVHFANLPVYIRDFSNCTVFNFISLKGVNPEVRITCEDEIGWESCPVKETVRYTLLVTVENHTADCELSVKSLISQLQVSYPQGNKITCKELLVILPVLLTFSSDRPFSFHTKLYISCLCGVKTHVKLIGCADDYRLTTHMYHFHKNMESFKVYSDYFSIRDESMELSRQPSIYRFPYFTVDDRSEDGIYMKNVCNFVEQWLCQQVFNGEYFCKIPDHMPEMFLDMRNIQEEKPKKVTFVEKTTKKKPRPTKKGMLVIVKILVNLLGDDVMANLTACKINDNPVDRVHDYNVINQYVLNFLEMQGAYIPHAQSKFMLNYDDYLLYEKRVRFLEGKDPAQNILDKTSFYLRTKQVWLDLLLQIFKVLVLPRMGKRSSTNSAGSKKSISQQSLLPYAKAYVDPETKLLSWAAIHFNKNRFQLMKFNHDNFILEPRLMKNFDSDFSDGLVFASLIISFLPYLVDELKDLYIDVNSEGKAFHNACIIVHILKTIKSSFYITSLDLMKPSPLHIIMFMTYLNEVLPCFLPICKIRFSVSLSNSKTETLTLKNMESIKVHYTLLFLNNTAECFSADCGNSVNIGPNKSVTVKILFKAKMMFPVTCTLIFCGETIGEHFARTIVYTLHGDSTLEQEHDTIVCNIPLFSIKTIPLHIVSPYCQAAKYAISIVFKKPEKRKNLLVPDESDIRISIVYSQTKFLDCNSSGEGDIFISLCSLTSVIQEFWIFFLNNEVGDYFIKIQQTSDITRLENLKIVEVFLPVGFENLKCICKEQKLVHRKDCPRNIAIPIPSKNNMFWKTIIDLFLTTVDSKEIDNWKELLYSSMGSDIMCWWCSDNLDNSPNIIKHAFLRTVKYEIFGPSNMFLPKFITIDDVKDCFNKENILAHLPDDYTTRFKLNFLSSDGLGFRTYKIHIRSENEKSNASVSEQELFYK